MIQPRKTSVLLIIIAAFLCASVTAVFAAIPTENAAQPADIPDNLPTVSDTDAPETEAPVPADDPLPAPPPETDAPAKDTLTLLFPLPDDCAWEITSPFGDVAYLPTRTEEDPPFYYLSRIPDPQATEPSIYIIVTDHDGVDLAAAHGTSVLAVADAVVLNAGWDYEKGNFVLLDCGYGITAEYRHLEKYSVSEGDTVSAWDVIGAVGRTGNATGPHLHFSLVVNGEYVDPMLYYKPVDVYADQP